MANEENVGDLLAAADEALVEAGFRTGDFSRTRELLEAAQTEADRSGDATARASALDRLGMLAHYENITKLMSGSELDSAEADAEEKLFRQALTCWQELGEQASTAQSLFGLGLVFQVLRDDWMTAMPYFWQALGLVSDPDGGADMYLRSEVHRHVGFYFLVEDVQPTEAVRHLQISLELREQLGDQRRIPSGQVALAQAELAAGRHGRAIDLLTSALAGAREAGLAPHRIEDTERNLLEAEAAAAGAPEPEAEAPQAEPAAAEAPEPEAEAPQAEAPDAEGPEPEAEAPQAEAPEPEAEGPEAGADG